MKLSELNARFESLVKIASTLDKDDYAKFMANIEMLKLKYQTQKHQNRRPDLFEEVTFKSYIGV
jgi:hypothetical protein